MKAAARLFILVALLTTTNALAAGDDNIAVSPSGAPQVTDVKTDHVKTDHSIEPSSPTEERFRRFGGSLAGSIYGLIVPTKYGAGAFWNFNTYFSLEAAIFRGSYGFSNSYIDIGGFSETVLSLDSRLFPFGGSFNFIAGLSEQFYKVGLGNDILARATNAPSTLEIEASTIGLQLGLGNRWIYHGFVFGVDWLVLNFPFYPIQTSTPALDNITNEGDRRRIGDALTVMRYLPTGAVLKLALGYEF